MFIASRKGPTELMFMVYQNIKHETCSLSTKGSHGYMFIVYKSGHTGHMFIVYQKGHTEHMVMLYQKDTKDTCL